MTSFSCRPPLASKRDLASPSSPVPQPIREADEAARLQRDRASQRVSALGEMTIGLTHDFRNILAVVQSAVRVAQRAGPGSPNADLAWAAINEAVGRGIGLTGELLVFARGGKPEIHPGNVNDLLTGATTFMKYGAGPGVNVTLDLATALPDCRIDAAQFNSTILNLVINARDAMPEGGEIRIATDECHEPCGDLAAPVERWVRVRISDQGSGMSAEIAEHLFDRYFTTKGDAGTGLGVPQVVAFMRACGGTVRVTTEPGTGTCFELRFPAADRGDQVDGGEWCQLDRWVNEGGSQRQHKAPSEQRERGEMTEPPRRRKRAEAQIEGGPARSLEQSRQVETLPSQIVQSIKPAVMASARRQAS